MQLLYHESEQKKDCQVVAALASCNSEIEAEAVIQQGLEEPWFMNFGAPQKWGWTVGGVDPPRFFASQKAACCMLFQSCKLLIVDDLADTNNRASAKRKWVIEIMLKRVLGGIFEAIKKVCQHHNPRLGGGNSNICYFHDPIWLIFFKWVETTN